MEERTRRKRMTTCCSSWSVHQVTGDLRAFSPGCTPACASPSSPASWAGRRPSPCSPPAAPSTCRPQKDKESINGKPPAATAASSSPVPQDVVVIVTAAGTPPAHFSPPDARRVDGHAKEGRSRQPGWGDTHTHNKRKYSRSSPRPPEGSEANTLGEKLTPQTNSMYKSDVFAPKSKSNVQKAKSILEIY